jgi:hypothetical protein
MDWGLQVRHSRLDRRRMLICSSVDQAHDKATRRRSHVETDPTSNPNARWSPAQQHVLVRHPIIQTTSSSVARDIPSTPVYSVPSMGEQPRHQQPESRVHKWFCPSWDWDCVSTLPSPTPPTGSSSTYQIGDDCISHLPRSSPPFHVFHSYSSLFHSGGGRASSTAGQ